MKKIKILGLALSIGITCAISVFFIKTVAYYFNFSIPLVSVAMMGAMGLKSIILGTIWGFIGGFIYGALIALFYNKIANK